MNGITEKRKEGFVLLPYKLIKACNGRVLSPIGAFIAGTIWSFSREGKRCNYGYNTFKKKLNVSKSTVARQIKEVKARSDMHVERRGGKCSEYTSSFDLGDGAYIDFPLFLTKTFEFEGKTVKLTPSEQLVLALVYTETKAQNGHGKLVGGPSKISGMLQGSVQARTVQTILSKLDDLRLISCRRRSINAHVLGEYVANMKAFKKIEKACKKAEKRAQQEIRLPEEVVNANARSDRKRYYELKRDKAERAAISYQNEIRSRCAEYFQTDREYRMAELAELKAIMYTPEKAFELEEKKKRIEIKRNALIVRFGIVPERLEAKYYYSCKRCSDTGHLPNGEQCDCYSEGGGL